MRFWNWIKSLFNPPAKKATGAAGAVLIAAKDVPTGKPYKIVDVSELPQDRSDRNAWTVDDEVLTDGVGADYGAGSENNVVGWAENGQPITRRRQPPVPPAVEAPRPTPIKIRPPQI